MNIDKQVRATQVITRMSGFPFEDGDSHTDGTQAYNQMERDIKVRTTIEGDDTLIYVPHHAVDNVSTMAEPTSVEWDDANCVEEDTTPRLTLDATEKTMVIGDTITIRATTVPSDATVEWQIPNAIRNYADVTVDGKTVTIDTYSRNQEFDGMIMAVMPDYLDEYGEDVMAPCVVRGVFIEIELSPSEPRIGVGETVQMVATTTPSGYENSVVWSELSGGAKITVNSSGLVTGVEPNGGDVQATIIVGQMDYSAQAWVAVS